MIQIELIKDGEPKVYSNPFVNCKHLRLTMEMNCDVDILEKKLIEEGKNPNISTALLDIYIDYICAMFNFQFTQDEFAECYEASKLHETVTKLINKVYSTGNKNGGESGKK